MRSPISSLALACALSLSVGAISPAHAQTLIPAAPAAAERSAPVSAPAPTLAESMVSEPDELRPPAHLDLVDVKSPAADVGAARQPSARNIFALIGAAVVVIALVALLR